MTHTTSGPPVQRAAFHWTTTTTANWLMKLGLCAAPIQWRKKTKLKSNQVDLTSVKFQSQRGKAKTVLFENKLTTASFPDRFFIHAVTVARQISDWKIKLHNSRNKNKAGKRVWKRSCFAFGRVGEKYMILCDITHVNACTKLDTYLCSLLRGPYN